MNILGLNGLGVLPSACILQNGQLTAMAEEERFTRKKGSFGMMPANATAFCLQNAKLNLSDLDAIAFGWDAKAYLFKVPFFLLMQSLKRVPQAHKPNQYKTVLQTIIRYLPFTVKKAIKDMLHSAGLSGKMPKIYFVPHHLAHAASTFYASGFESAYIVVPDGSGEIASTSIFKGKGTNISLVKSFNIPDSLGWFYQTVTEYLGFEPNNHEGKTMALAAYGNYNELIFHKLNKLIQWDEKGNYTFNPIYAFAGNHTKSKVYSNEFEALFHLQKSANHSFTSEQKDLAFATQYILEDIMKKLVQQISTKQDFNGNLCVAGGVGLNCKMNGAIAVLPEVEKLYVPPITSDAGSALGAAQIISVQKGGHQCSTIEHAYFGPAFEDDHIEKALKNHGLSFTKEEDIAKKTTHLLVENKIVGWFQGRMEIGSRALGARSILANPLKKDARDYVNAQVKNRALWRPFAASILEEKTLDFFDSKVDSPFMAQAFEVKPEMAKKIPAVVHIDNTTRPQIVSKKSNPLYWELIQHFGNATQVYAVLNTSFNLKEEPIVCTPNEAIKSFLHSGIDALAIGSFLVLKEK